MKYDAVRLDKLADEILDILGFEADAHETTRAELLENLIDTLNAKEQYLEQQ